MDFTLYIKKSIFRKMFYKHMSSISDFDKLPLVELAEKIQRDANDTKQNLEAILSTEALQPFNNFYWKVLLFAQRVKKELG